MVTEEDWVSYVHLEEFSLTLWIMVVDLDYVKEGRGTRLV